MADGYKAIPGAIKSAATLPVSLLSGTVRAAESRRPGRTAKQSKANRGAELSGPGIMVSGTFYPVRTLNSDDTDVLYQFLQEGLSEESRQLRFMTPMPTVSPTAAAWLADRDGHDRVALAVMHPVDPTIVVAVVEYASFPDGPPEVAVAVADAFQGRGIGSNVLRMLATMSLAAGQPVWRCDVLADNDGPLRMLATVGTVELGSVSGGVRSVRVELDPHRLLGTTVVI